MTYRLTISDIEEVALSNFLTDDLHIDHYEDDILKSRSSSWKWNNMILPLVIYNAMVFTTYNGCNGKLPPFVELHLLT
ncbi:hypothetical protein T12_7052 [Trichinella patagoniensis]|uniref:Uncharacterized protein n=1 Tax=Trichinella patagoniensis TaxID=990121 RepID=A0A0V0YWN6_9BILA|nr:hypothetical protein T12_7052 [Trichinella patagoniensis]